VTCPTVFVLGSVDQVTPPKAAQGLIKAAHARAEWFACLGHHQMNETPEPMLAELIGF